MRFRNISLIAFLIIIVALGIVGTSFADEETPPVSEPSVSRSKENPTPLTFPLSVAGDLTVAPSDEIGPALITPLMVGGTEVSPQNAYPWVASLQYDGKHYCGGTLIHPQWILTAAHCWVDPSGIVYPITEFDSAVLGEHSLTTPSSTEQEIGFSEVHVHPDFNLDTFENDFALLKLSSPANITASVKTIELVGASVGGLVGQASVIVGWGATAYGGPLSDTAQYANISILADSACSNYSTDYKASSMLCAGTLDGSKDACQGDSGGPLAYQVSGAWKQAGIVSWGYECGVAGYPGVYSRISSAVGWIAGFVPNVTGNEKPVTPTLIAPVNNATTTSTPTFQWSHDPNSTSYWFRINRKSDGAVVIWKDLSAASVCSGSVCSYSYSLALGQYEWIVRGVNNIAVSPVPSPGLFTVSLAKPLTPRLLAPIGNILTGSKPDFQWTESVGATNYWFRVDRQSDSAVMFWIDIPAAGLCSSGSCYFPNPGWLRPGEYSWIVRAVNAEGVSGTPPAAFFTVAPKPSLPKLISPIGNQIVNNKPVFQWTQTNNTTKFWFRVNRVSDGSVLFWKEIPLTSVCSAGICSYPSPGWHTQGQYLWIVRAVDDFGASGEPVPGYYSVLTP